MYKEILKNMHPFNNLAKICKCMHIQTEKIERLCYDSYRFLKFHMIGVIKKNMLFMLCTSLIIIIDKNLMFIYQLFFNFLKKQKIYLNSKFQS
jgi:hypothetical protein